MIVRTWRMPCHYRLHAGPMSDKIRRGIIGQRLNWICGAGNRLVGKICFIHIRMQILPEIAALCKRKTEMNSCAPR